MERDGYGMTPLLAASVTGHANIVEFLIRGALEEPRSQNPEEEEEEEKEDQQGEVEEEEEEETGGSRVYCTREAAVEALELLGATMVDKKRDLLGALKHWRRAMGLRLRGGEGLSKPEPRQRVLAYDYAQEVSSMEELEALITDPDEMRMQALLI